MIKSTAYSGVLMMFFFGTVFIIFSVIHLVGCCTDNRKICAVTKPALMPLLALTSVFALVPGLPGTRFTLVCTVLALAWGTAGDTLLLKTDEKHFIPGALCFLVGHFFWIAQNASSFASLSPLCIVIGTVCYAAFLAAAYFVIGKPKGVMGIGVMVYGVVLCALNFTAIAALAAGGCSQASWFYFAGSVLFLVSDSLLGFTVMKKPFRFSSFIIMLTYILAQAFLAAGVITK